VKEIVNDFFVASSS